MGKIPPSMRYAKLPLTFFKPPPAPSPSPSTPPSLPHSQSPKPRRPPLPKNPLKKKKKPSAQAPSPLAPPSPPPIFQSPVLSDALATFDSLSAATAEAGASLDLATLLRSFCDAGASPANAPCSATSPHLTPRPPTLPSALSAPPPASTIPAPFFAASPPPPPLSFQMPSPTTSSSVASPVSAPSPPSMPSSTSFAVPLASDPTLSLTPSSSTPSVAGATFVRPLAS